jgi:hypothetical protein
MEILQDHGDDAFDQALNDILALEGDPTPAFLPLVTPQWRMGEYVVIPAQRRGAAPARSRLDGTCRTKRSSTTTLSE